MFTDDIENNLQAQRMIPAIICTADASHYLIGAEDSLGNFYNAFSADSSQPLMASSLEQAKSVLRAKGIAKALVEMQTPYDEMVGLETQALERCVLTI